MTLYGAPMLNCVGSWMTLSELAELRRQLDELLESGYIQASKALYGAPMLFQKKQDGSMQMCVDYRALNKVWQIPPPLRLKHRVL